MTFPGTARYPVALLAALGLFMLATGTAQAGVASVAGPVISFKAGHGELNDVVADPRPDGVLFTDASSPIGAGDGCTAQLVGVLCSYPGRPFDGEPKIVELQLGNRDDHGSVENPGFLTEMRVLGGTGADHVGVGGSNPHIGLAVGGPGDDVVSSNMNFSGLATLRGGGGDDELDADQIGGLHAKGGNGADRLVIGPLLFPGPSRVFDGGNGADTILFIEGNSFEFNYVSAGRGFDTISFEVSRFPAFVNLQLCPACDVERVVGSPAADYLVGDDGSTLFEGGASHDEIFPRGGKDAVFAGDGADRVDVAGDKATDFVSCGADLDTVVADRRDRIATDCERVTRAEAAL